MFVRASSGSGGGGTSGMATGTLPDVPTSATVTTQVINTGLSQIKRFFLYCNGSDGTTIEVIAYNSDFDSKYVGYRSYTSINVVYSGANAIGSQAYQNAPILMNISGGDVTINFQEVQPRTNITWYAE